MLPSNKPPDPYKAIKISLDKILLNDKTHNKETVKAGFSDAGLRTNEYVIHICQFVELFALGKYRNDQPIPELDVKFIKTVGKALSRASAGPRSQAPVYNELLNFYKNEYMFLIIDDNKRKYINELNKLIASGTVKGKKLQKNIDKLDEAIEETKFDGLHLSAILSYQATDIITNITNNIQMNFYKYLVKFVRNSIIRTISKFSIESYYKNINVYKQAKDILASFLKKYSTSIPFNKNDSYLYEKRKFLEDNVKLYKCLLDVKTERKNGIMKIINRNLYSIINDLVDNTSKAPEEYRYWINTNRPLIIPKYTHTYEEELSANPQAFLPKMIFMNKAFEKIGVAQYQVFPLRKSFIPKYITIDTKALIELFTTSNLAAELKDIEGCKDKKWSDIIDLNHKIFTRKNYSFNYMILTDGIICSILLVHTNQLAKDNTAKANKKAGKEKLRVACEGMTPSEKAVYKKKITEDKKKAEAKKRQENAIFRKNLKEKNKKEKDDFEVSIKELSVKEKKIKRGERAEKLKADKKKPAKKNATPYVEFPYVNEDLSEEMIQFLKQANKIYCDPGKRDLVSMMDDKGKYFRYSNRQHIFKTERLKNQKYIENQKKTFGIIEYENMLSGVSAKTCDYDKFKEYIKLKAFVSRKVSVSYQDAKFRKYKWYGYLNRQRANSWLVNDIAATYSENSVIIMGDWNSNHQMRGSISTPGIGLKRRLAEKFRVFNLDEFRTSCLHNKTEEKCENMTRSYPDGKSHKIHAILTYKMSNNRYGCIQRDKNAVNNMKNIVESYLDKRERPLRFRRDFSLDPPNTKKTIDLKDARPPIFAAQCFTV